MAVIEGTVGQLKKRLSDAQLLRDTGHLIPEPFFDLLKDEIRKKEGIVEVWECNRCARNLELFVKAVEVSCKCGKIRRIWKA